MSHPGIISQVGETFQQGPRTIIVPDKIFPILSHGDTTVDVHQNNIIIFQNLSPITVTNFTGGQSGQLIHILGDGFTTLQNNANIVTLAGADELLLANIYYSFLNFNGVWHEHNSSAPASSGGGGGGGGTTTISDPFNIPFEFGDGINIAPNVIAGNAEIDFDCDITQQTIVGNPSGSAVVDILVGSNSGGTPTSICGSAKPSLVSQSIERDSVLNTWIKHITAGSIIQGKLLSVSGCTKITVTLKLLRTLTS